MHPIDKQYFFGTLPYSLCVGIKISYMSYYGLCMGCPSNHENQPKYVLTYERESRTGNVFKPGGLEGFLHRKYVQPISYCLFRETRQHEVKSECRKHL